MSIANYPMTTAEVTAIRLKKEDVSLSALIIQKVSVRLLRRPLVCAQVKVTGGDEPVVPQDGLDMPNGAAIKKKCCRHSVAQHVRCHRLGKADHLSVSPEPNERGIES